MRVHRSFKDITRYVFTMNLIILICAITTAFGRPQQGGEDQSSFNIAKQTVVKETPGRTLLDTTNTDSRAENTKKILAKIAEVNERHGYVPKGLKAFDGDIESSGTIRPLDQHRSFDNNRFYSIPPPRYRHHESPQQNNNFQFPNTPFQNPIFDYLNRQNNGVAKQNLGVETNDDDAPPEGYVIKRKVTHHQSYFVPSQVLQNQMPQNTYPIYMTDQPFQNQPPTDPIISNGGEDTRNTSESDDLYGPGFNRRNLYYNTPDETFLRAYQNGMPAAPYNPYYQSQMNYGNLQPEPYYQQNVANTRQINWPFSGYFPIVINDPFLMMYNAFTSMVEYGPEADVCKRKDAGGKPKTGEESTLFTDGKSYSTSRSGKAVKLEKTDEDVEKEIPEVTIDSIQITQQPDNRTDRQLSDEINRPAPSDAVEDDADNIKITSGGSDLGKANDKKIFSRDNTGSGIFIQKLKVRKGGVAIAGPGGIATAGGGGTAIVGPNGFAFTQPNGLAIAGPGASVVAIPAEYNLTEVVINAHNEQLNGESEHGRKLPAGSKIVARGPIVYLNQERQ